MNVPGRSVLADPLPPESSRSASGAGLADTRPEIELLLDSARVCLEDEDAQRLRAQLRRDLDWDLPAAHGAAERGDAPPLPPPQRGRVRRRPARRSWISFGSPFIENSLHNLFMTGELFKLLDLFGAHGIGAIPYKGPTLAALAYGNLALREFDDLDLLLPERDIPRARDLLIAQGFRPGYTLTRARRRPPSSRRGSCIW